MRSYCCTKYRKKGQRQEKRLHMSVDESLSSEDVEKEAEVFCAKKREVSSLSVIFNDANHIIETKNENAVGSGQENKVQEKDTYVTSPQELSDNPTNMEFGKAPVDARKDICYPTVMEPAETIDKAKDGGEDVLEKNRKNPSQFLRQTTEDDMVELRRMNERINSTKQSTSTPHDLDLTPSEIIYFEKSVFAKQNVEAELYLSEEVFPASVISSKKLADEDMHLSDAALVDRDDLSTSLSVIIEDPEQIPDLKLDCISSDERVSYTHSPENKQKNEMSSPVRTYSPEDRDSDARNLESTVIEEFEFSLTEDQITARSRLSTAMSSRVTSALGSRRVSPAGAIIKGLRESIGGSKREPRRVEGPRGISRYTAYSVPMSGSKAKGHVKPSNPTISVPKRTASAISRPRNPTKKYKISRINNGPEAPKMKFRWI